LIPEIARAERPSLDVPTFLAFGEDGLVTDDAASLAHFRSVNEAALYVLTGSGHCHN
jgi:pimeloyl-ACP methyl ester carboxylesterase